jgi:hypothetical protein
MTLLPRDAADSATAAAAHLWHLIHQLGGSPGSLRGGPQLARWRDLACELTVFSEQQRARAAGRRAVPFDDQRDIHVAALRAAILQVLEDYRGDRRAAG